MVAIPAASLRRPSSYRGKRCSLAHRIVLVAAERAGVEFVLNDGQRTRADQEQRIRDHGVYDPVRNPHGAARYSPNAPHVKAGLANHALDLDMFRPTPGGHRRLVAFYARNGCVLVFNVATEGWHADPTDEPSLLATANRLADPLREYPADERRWIHEFDVLSRAAVKPDRRRVLVRVMTARRKSIWRAAQKSGWEQLNRRARYNSLAART